MGDHVNVCVLAEGSEDEEEEELHLLLTLLRRRGLTCRVVNAWTSFSDVERLRPSVVLNLARPCAHMNQCSDSLQNTLDRFLDLEGDGVAIINGVASIQLDAGKINQYRVMRQLGMRHPQVMLFRSLEPLRYRLSGFPFPAVVRKNVCSLDACVHQVSSVEDIAEYLSRHPSARHDGCLLQAMLPSTAVRQGIVQMVFAGGQLLFAHRVRPTLSTCDTTVQRIIPASRHLIPPRFGGFHTELVAERDIPYEALSAAQRLIQHVGIGFASVEYCVTEDKQILFCDAQAVSRLRFPPGLDRAAALSGLADYIGRELRRAHDLIDDSDATLIMDEGEAND